MVFSSMVFIFRFMPLFFLIYFLTPQKYRNIVLFLGSIVFYAIGEPVYILLMLFSILANYGFSIFMLQSEDRQSRKLWLVIALVLDFGLLFLFKYFNFFAENINLLFHQEIIPALQITLPLGISFYTFQIASYMVDVYKDKLKYHGSLLEFGTYVCMFPQLIAGPIVKYQEVAYELRKRKVVLKDVERGLEIFCFGLGSKVILANQIATLWNQVQGIGFENLSTPMAWLGAFAYSFQIYFDFWGYSLMAIGLGKIMGFSIPVNFRCPYMVKSTTEFWRRWHITLGRFFREYVYIPLGGNRGGTLKMLRNTFVVWALTGLWHGASWNFVLWGLTFFVILMLEKLFLGKFLERSHVIGRLYVWLIIPVTWVIFAITDFSQLLIYMKQLVGIHEGEILVSATQFLRYLKSYGTLLFACCFCSTGIPEWVYHKIRGGLVVVLTAAVVFWWSVYTLASGVNNPFLYFRF